MPPLMQREHMGQERVVGPPSPPHSSPEMCCIQADSQDTVELKTSVQLSLETGEEQWREIELVGKCPKASS